MICPGMARLRRLLPGALILVATALLAGWTVTAVWAAAPSPAASPSIPGGDPAAGAQVYAQNCAVCHGSSLEGGVGPKLNPIAHLPGVSNPLDPDYLVTTITSGRAGGAMPAFGGKLSPKQINDVASYIMGQNVAGKVTLSPVELAKSNVFWVTIGVGLLAFLTYLLSRYNMRWIARRADARRERERGSR